MYYTKAEIQEKDGKIIGIASSSVEDRQGEVVDVDGWDLKSFKKAPRLLWAHNHQEPAIGKVTKTYYEGTGRSKRLMFEAVFQEVTEMGRAIKQLVKDGFINTFSVGFKPLEIDGNVITKSELLEISVVNVPANPDAMMLAYKSLQKADIEQDVINKIVPTTDDSNVNPDPQAQIDALKAELAAVKETAEIAVKGLKYLAPQRSKQEVVTRRLQYSRVIAKAADKLVVKPGANTASHAKIIKLTSEKLIRDIKGDL